MSKRIPCIENTEAIQARLIEIQRERAVAIAGCNCQQNTLGEVNHRPGCALRPRSVEVMAIVTAIERARLRGKLAR